MANIIQEKSYHFSLRIISLYRRLYKQREFVISRQLLRCGTSIGANVEEALGSYSRKDFHFKMVIAFKEARETHYWLRLIRDAGLSGEELLRILKAITRRTRPLRS